MVFRLNLDSLESSPDKGDELFQTLDRLRSTLFAVSTGGPKINTVNDEYKADYALVTEQLRERGLENPFPYSDLWDWYGKWSSGDLPTYKSRREYIRGLFEPLETALVEPATSHVLATSKSGTHWEPRDQGLDGGLVSSLRALL